MRAADPRGHPSGEAHEWPTRSREAREEAVYRKRFFSLSHRMGEGRGEGAFLVLLPSHGSSTSTPKLRGLRGFARVKFGSLHPDFHLDLPSGQEHCQAIVSESVMKPRMFIWQSKK